MLRAHLAFCLQISAFTWTFEKSSSKGLSLAVLPISLIKNNQAILKKSTFYQYCNLGKSRNLEGKLTSQTNQILRERRTEVKEFEQFQCN